MSILRSIINTIDAKWYVLILVRLFGSRSIEIDNFGDKIVIKKFLGKQYFMSRNNEH